MGISIHRARKLVAALLLGLSDLGEAGVRKEVQFNQGELSATFQGTVTPTERDRYFLIAKAGQQLRLQLQSSSGNGVFSLFGPGYFEESNAFVSGKSMQYEATAARVSILTNGTHLVDVSSLGGATAYRMTLTLDDASAPGSAQFSGATGGELSKNRSTDETQNNLVSSQPNLTTPGNASTNVADAGVPSVEPPLTEGRDGKPPVDARVTSAPLAVEEPKREEMIKPMPSANVPRNGDGTEGFFVRLASGSRSLLNTLTSALGMLLLACGVLSCCVGGLLMPKPDRRFKTGYKDNEVVTWQFRAMVIGLALGVTGLLLLRISV